MNIDELFDALIVAGIDLVPDGTEHLFARPQPGKAIPPEIVEALRTLKPLVLTPALQSYIRVLAAWRPANDRDLPPAPMFKARPERPLAWAAWWTAVETVRRQRKAAR